MAYAYKNFTCVFFFVIIFLVFNVNIIYSTSINSDFLLVNISARETALGGIYSPFYAKPGASTVNPASLMGIVARYIIFSHYTSVFDTHYEQILYAQPVNAEDYISTFLFYDSNDNLERTDSEGYAIEKIENYDILIGSSYCRQFEKEFSLGITTKVFLSKIYKSTDFGVVLNLGALYRNFEKRYLLGFVFENFGLSTKYTKEQSLFPMIIRAGYGVEIYRELDIYKIAMYIEERVYLNEIEGTETSLGLEAQYLDIFTFRYGYIFGISEGRIALGAGVKIESFYIDYAYQPFFVSDNAHRFTIKYIF